MQLFGSCSAVPLNLDKFFGNVKMTENADEIVPQVHEQTEQDKIDS
jgi:hypothetical protein